MSKKKRVGIIVSDKTNKTTIVAVQTRYQHPKYRKTLIRTKRYMVHDEQNKGCSGDLVLIEESSPFSKRKKWNLKKILLITLNNNI
jgi:small subunit ribosomal protein S17